MIYQSPQKQVLDTRDPSSPGLSTGWKYRPGQLGSKYFSSDHSIPEISPLVYFQLQIYTSATL